VYNLRLRERADSLLIIYSFLGFRVGVAHKTVAMLPQVFKF
jgi:hypothetical protein